MIRYLTKTFAILFAISLPVQADEVADLKAIGIWSIEFQNTYSQSLKVLQISEQTESAAESFFAGDTSKEEAKAQLQEIQSDFQAQVEANAKRIKLLGSPPQPRSVARQAKHLKKNFEFLQDFDLRLENFSRDSISLFKSALGTDDLEELGEIESQFRSRIYRRYIFSLEGENQFITASIEKQDKDHPQRYIGTLSLVCNESFIAIFSALMEFNLENPDVEKLLTRLAKTNENKKRTDRVAQTGLKMKERMLTKLPISRARDANEREIYVILHAAFENYDESFELERQIAAEMVRFADLMKGEMGTGKVEGFDNAMSDWGTKVDNLIARRLKLQKERATKLAQLQ